MQSAFWIQSFKAQNSFIRHIHLALLSPSFRTTLVNWDWIITDRTHMINAGHVPTSRHHSDKRNQKTLSISFAKMHHQSIWSRIICRRQMMASVLPPQHVSFLMQLKAVFYQQLAIWYLQMLLSIYIMKLGLFHSQGCSVGVASCVKYDHRSWPTNFSTHCSRRLMYMKFIWTSSLGSSLLAVQSYCWTPCDFVPFPLDDATKTLVLKFPNVFLNVVLNDFVLQFIFNCHYSTTTIGSSVCPYHYLDLNLILLVYNPCILNFSQTSSLLLKVVWGGAWSLCALFVSSMPVLVTATKLGTMHWKSAAIVEHNVFPDWWPCDYLVSKSPITLFSPSICSMTKSKFRRCRAHLCPFASTY